jgi:hypothetical protein
MKKELYIPSYKESGSKKNDASYIAALVIVIVIIFGGISLKGLTAYAPYGTQLKNFPVQIGLNDKRSFRDSNPVTSIKITPETVIAGGTINIEVNPGLQGARKRGKIFYWGPGINDVKKCGKGTLQNNDLKPFGVDGFSLFETESFRFKTGKEWREGKYAYAAFDINFNDWVCQPFYIYRENERSEDVVSWGSSRILNELSKGVT